MIHRWLLANFEQVKKLTVILLTLNNSKKINSHFTDTSQKNKSHFAAFEQLKNISTTQSQTV